MQKQEQNQRLWHSLRSCRFKSKSKKETRNSLCSYFFKNKSTR